MCAQGPLLAGEPHLKNMVMPVGEIYNKLAGLRGRVASLHQSQEHGKANTELISKTSKGGRFLPKITRTCPSVSASLPLSLSRSLLLLPVFPSLSTLEPFILSPHCETFYLLKIGSSYTASHPSVLTGARCKSSWRHLSVQEQ